MTSACGSQWAPLFVFVYLCGSVGRVSNPLALVIIERNCAVLNLRKNPSLVDLFLKAFI